MVSLKLSLVSAIAATALANNVQVSIHQPESANDYDHLHRAISAATESWSNSHSRLQAVHSNLNNNHVDAAISSLGSVASNSNSALWQLSEACCCCCCGGGSYTTGPVPSDPTAGGGIGFDPNGGGFVTPVMGALFPVRNNAFNLVRAAVGNLMRPLMQEMITSVNGVTRALSASKSKSSASVGQAKMIVSNLEMLLKNTNEINVLAAEREQLTHAVSALSKAITV